MALCDWIEFDSPRHIRIAVLETDDANGGTRARVPREAAPASRRNSFPVYRGMRGILVYIRRNPLSRSRVVPSNGKRAYRYK